MDTLNLAPSSMIKQASYDPGVLVLEVTFANGSRYAYDDVPQDVVDALEGAESPGKYFLASVRGVYSASRLWGVSGQPKPA